MNSAPNDEIDLQQLSVKVIRYFVRHFMFISMFTAFGIIAGITYYILVPSTFESKMIVMSDILTESYSDRITESLDRLIREGNDSVLAGRLNLNPEEAYLIKSIKIESAKKKATTDKEETIFIITADVASKAILPKLQEGLINFLRNNEFVKTRVQQREQMYRILVDRIGQEIKSLDSLKKRLFQGKPIYSNSSEMMLVDPTNIYSKIIELTQQQINFKNALELHDSIQLIEGFTPFQKPQSPKLSIALISGFFLGFFGAIGILTLKGLLKMARQNKYQEE